MDLENTSKLVAQLFVETIGSRTDAMRLAGLVMTEIAVMNATDSIAKPTPKTKAKLTLSEDDITPFESVEEDGPKPRAISDDVQTLGGESFGIKY